MTPTERYSLRVYAPPSRAPLRLVCCCMPRPQAAPSPAGRPLPSCQGGGQRQTLSCGLWHAKMINGMMHPCCRAKHDDFEQKTEHASATLPTLIQYRLALAPAPGYTFLNSQPGLTHALASSAFAPGKPTHNSTSIIPCLAKTPAHIWPGTGMAPALAQHRGAHGGTHPLSTLLHTSFLWSQHGHTPTIYNSRGRRCLRPIPMLRLPPSSYLLSPPTAT